MSEWTLPGGALLRLKSDASAVDGSQLSLDVDVPSIGGETIVLTYDHDGPERTSPAFMQPLGKRHQAWVWTPARLLASVAEDAPKILPARRPMTRVSSALPPAEHVQRPQEQSADDRPERS